jgi:hypothetical protein
MTECDDPLTAAWDLWREASCLERGGHFWTRPRGEQRTRACLCCPVMLRDCDVCGTEFTTADYRRHRCSGGCREFACQHKSASSAQLRRLWEQEQQRIRPCPSGKVRHQKKRDAEKSARAATYARYSAVRNWLRVYECDLCRGWHLTSKPRGRRSPAAA